MDILQYIPLSEIQRIRKSIQDPILSSKVLADIFRINILYMITRAGSGHPGTSFSCVDIATWLFGQEMTNANENDMDPSDTYFSSKGHDVPALYAILIGLEKIAFEYMHKFRRLGGLPGHPDIGTPYMITNTGSLGMGISKAHGMAVANRLNGKKGRFYVLTGDGELQEGQIWESLPSVANGKFSEITVIVDHNKIQSDIHVKDTSDLGSLEDKFKAFGWEVARCDGHDLEKVREVLARFKMVKDKPQVLIADTIKGKGVSFMEKFGDDGFYKFHSGAPSLEQFNAALKEILDRANKNIASAGQPQLQLVTVEVSPRPAPTAPQRLIAAYSDELLKIARERKDIIGLDADLVLDTGLLPFKKEFPQRYIECGIAEQDMVSIAGGVALRGLLPIVHSFACFLSTRSNEQIYNNATEHTKIIYTASLAGLLPGTPGHSHQSVRDISCVGAIPDLVMIEPSGELETRKAIRWAVEKNSKNTYIRLISIPADTSYALPEGYELEEGRGVFVREGKDCAIVSYGMVMLEQAHVAAELLGQKGISAAVVNFPWLNYVDSGWLMEKLGGYRLVATIDDHYVAMGQGAMIAAVFARNGVGTKVLTLGLEKIPVCGQNIEVIEHHKLDSKSIAERIEKSL